MKKEHKMPASIDFSGGERGKFFGKVRYANRTMARPSNPSDSLQEAVSLLSRARRHLAEDGSAQKVKEAINEFLERRAS